jgi:putative ubiquitin-RnfH superfamily antitoxin RatB of RatAB toxin-antitoxin module
MSEFLHHIVKKQERAEEYRTLMIDPPTMRIPSALLEAINRDMSRHYADTWESGEETNG